MASTCLSLGIAGSAALDWCLGLRSYNGLWFPPGRNAQGELSGFETLNPEPLNPKP